MTGWIKDPFTLIGTICLAVGGTLMASGNPTAALVGQILAAIGTGLGGYAVKTHMGPKVEVPAAPVTPVTPAPAPAPAPVEPPTAG